MDIDCYQRWWKGKEVRPVGSDRPFKRVADVRWCGSPSGVYGAVWLTFEDGTEESAPQGVNAFRPRKRDMEVKL